MSWSKQTKNTATYTNAAKASTTFDRPYRKGTGQTWTNILETWQDLYLVTWTNQTKS